LGPVNRAQCVHDIRDRERHFWNATHKAVVERKFAARPTVAGEVRDYNLGAMVVCMRYEFLEGKRNRFACGRSIGDQFQGDGRITAKCIGIGENRSESLSITVTMS